MNEKQQELLKTAAGICGNFEEKLEEALRWLNPDHGKPQPTVLQIYEVPVFRKITPIKVKRAKKYKIDQN